MTTERVVVINEALAAKYFGSEDPIGRVLQTGFDEHGERIVGVVANVAEANLTDAPAPARYMLYEQVPTAILPETTFVLRVASAADVPAMVQAARNTLEREAPHVAVHRVTSMQAVFDEAVGPAGQVVTLVSMLAGLALVLGAVGVYGVISHFVARRSRDYGIRIALGLAPDATRVAGRRPRAGARGHRQRGRGGGCAAIHAPARVAVVRRERGRSAGHRRRRAGTRGSGIGRGLVSCPSCEPHGPSGRPPGAVGVETTMSKRWTPRLAARAGRR